MTKNYNGERFGKLEILETVSTEGRRVVLCKCDCGTKKAILLDNIKRGLTKTCGCGFNNEVIDLEGEIWKDIPGFEGLYKASNKGRVKSKKGIVKERLSNAGYKLLALYKDKKYTKKGVHRFVMMAFHGVNELDVNHIDGIKTNNNLENLEYCTKSENMQHAYRTGLQKPIYGEKNHRYGMKGILAHDSRKVNQYDLNGNFIKTWDSIADIHRDIGLSQGNIVTVCKGNRNHTGGFKWKYYEES